MNQNEQELELEEIINAIKEKRAEKNNIKYEIQYNELFEEINLYQKEAKK